MGRVLIQRRVLSACHNMLKKSISSIWASYFFLEYPFGTPFLELSSEIPVQDFNLLVNIDNFFPVFLLIIIGILPYGHTAFSLLVTSNINFLCLTLAPPSLAAADFI